jgi:nucleotide-binding universal stress UspA family protein
MITQKSVVIENFVESGPKIGKARLETLPEQKIQQILVPVDPANDCRASIEHAIALTSIFGSTVALVHFLEGSLHPRNCDVFKLQRRKVFADFTDLLQKARDRYPKSVGYFGYGNPDYDICKIARQLNADLLVLGTHKDRWLERVFLGRHADRILADAPCPVLVVREEETDFTDGPDQV